MINNFFRKVFEIYQIKLNKYKGQDIDNNLDQMLWQESLIAVKTSEEYNGEQA